MANLVCKRLSTDRQDLVLNETGIEDPVVFEEQAGTSSRVSDLDDAERATLDQGVTVRRGQSYLLRAGPARDPPPTS